MSDKYTVCVIETTWRERKAGGYIRGSAQTCRVMVVTYIVRRDVLVRRDACSPNLV